MSNNNNNINDILNIADNLNTAVEAVAGAQRTLADKIAALKRESATAAAVYEVTINGRTFRILSEADPRLQQVVTDTDELRIQPKTSAAAA